ncbi:MAG TPA: A24 family peptidase [Caldilineaceae bacterium]|nr:A24 family peptidase [Caldilineaceae bacterium]
MENWREAALILLLGLAGGWGVNLLADTLPERRSLRASWRAPWAALSGHTAHGWRTRLVFLAAIALAALAYGQKGLTLQSGVTALYAWFFLAIAVIDLEHRRVLNWMLGPALLIMAAISLLLRSPQPLSALLGALAGFSFFLLSALLRRGGLGMGDVKLAGIIGLATGLGGVVVAVVVGVLAGGVAALLLLFWTRFDRRATMAYAPYLVLGAWTALFWGQSLWAWYIAYFQSITS